jgi:hypothetical protein
MKPTLLIAVTIITASTSNNIKAQVAMNYSHATNFKTVTYDGATADYSSNTDERALNNTKLNAVKDFMKRYSTATDVKWLTTDDGGLVAKFNESSVQNTVAYNKAGNWVHTIRRYYETDMPKNVRAIVKSVYYDYTILRIEEITGAKNNSLVFVVHVQDDTTLKILRICDNEMNVLHEYIRGDK